MLSSIYDALKGGIEELKDAVVRALRALGDARRELNIFRIQPHECNAERFIGVDGSYVITTRGALTVIIVKAVAVELSLDGGKLSPRVLVTEGPRAYVSFSPAESIEERLAAEELMSIHETRVLEKLADMKLGSETLIVLDGPLADPPRPAPQSRLARRELGDTDYHAWRASILRRVASRCILVGYVKRPSGTRWLPTSMRLRVDDLLVARAALNPFEATRPRAAPETGVYTLYKLYYSYMRLNDIVARVEGLGAMHVVRGVECLARLPLARHPLVVQVAHEAATLHASDAELFYTILARKLVRELGVEATRNLLGI